MEQTHHPPHTSFFHSPSVLLNLNLSKLEQIEWIWQDPLGKLVTCTEGVFLFPASNNVQSGNVQSQYIFLLFLKNYFMLSDIVFFSLSPIRDLIFMKAVCCNQRTVFLATYSLFCLSFSMHFTDSSKVKILDSTYRWSYLQNRHRPKKKSKF